MYSVIAYFARYWFAFLMVIILWRAVIWLRKDAHRSAVVQSLLPDAGFIGEWAVMEGEEGDLAEGVILNAPRDGWLGAARACDVRIRSEGVPARAARFTLRHDGLHVLPRQPDTIVVDGEPVRKEAVLRHGATLTVGDVTLQLRLFAGVLLSGEVPAAKAQARKTPKSRQNNEAPAARVAPAPERQRAPVPQATEEQPSSLPRPTLTITTRRSRRSASGTRRPEA